MTKPFYKSKTFWFNTLALLTIIASQFGFGEFKPDAWVNEVGVTIVLIINLILRFNTKEGITIK